jgi:hypothetical protein
MKNIHILETNQPSRLHLIEDKLLLTTKCSIGVCDTEVHLYITSDEEIKEGDVVLFNNIETVICTYSNNGEFLFSGDLTSSSNHHFSNFKKIILTTDSTLITDGVQAIDDTFLDWLVQNPSCEFIPIITTIVSNSIIYKTNIGAESFRKEPKQETLEEVAELDLSNLCYYDKRNPDYTPYNEDDLTEMPNYCFCDNCFYGRTKLTEQLIMQAERMYSEEEVEQLLYEVVNDSHCSSQRVKQPNSNNCAEFVNNWFEKFKKK